ncbi:MAG TPA: protein kinase, partial [Candidatus Saccharimonadales bacterium]|nr:protein kinase [Candidatus Saccharimonadales bacterium]
MPARPPTRYPFVVGRRLCRRLGGQDAASVPPFPACRLPVQEPIVQCPDCGTELPEGAASCPRCGASCGPGSNQPAAPDGERSATSAIPTLALRGEGEVSSPPSSAAPRLSPGTTLGSRYRIVALAGAGGMGEVYRAEDLKLGQTVALKLIREGTGRQEASLARLLDEVRIARQVSHPNVCRVYDVGEADGHHFISMEWIEGEDLSALLRRRGRLPAGRALSVARQICAGLAAAHECRVL